ncbi:MAG: hypothetical protein ACI8YQ_000001, partial [Polaribacter sp.]
KKSPTSEAVDVGDKTINTMRNYTAQI